MDNRPLLEEHAFGDAAEFVAALSRGRCVDVEAPYAGNPNLQAQRGLFTLVRHYREIETLPFPTIEAVLTKYEQDPEAPPGYGPWLRKWTLPWHQAPRVLRLLDGFNINAATLFPGYDGVVRSIEEREFWGSS